jgi:large subunit ribosomal protein L15
MKLAQFKNDSNSNRKKRVGRGRSSGLGKTSGRGTKGQKSRSGHRNLPPFFEGGQMPLVQRLPKLRGGKKIKRREWEIVNIEKLNVFQNDSEVNRKLLLEKKLIKSPRSLVKILGNGELNKKLSISADSFSQSATDKIKKAGGKITKSTEFNKAKVKEKIVDKNTDDTKKEK